jgi:O-succinylbenzoic acid--CoA ligase
VTSQLVALDLPGGAEFVDALRRVWDRGDAAFPVDQRLPAAAQHALLAAMAPASVIDPNGEHTVSGGRPAEPGDALVVATSGSTGEPKGAVLTHDAVRSSALATSERLSVTENDHWLACLPLAHVGGLSVVTRAIHTGTTLTVLPRFDVDAVEAAAREGATLVSLVSTALGRIDASLFRTIVLGGAAPPPDRPANTVTTYGMTETGSGVVYDGVPLDDVAVRIGDDAEILLRGPMLLRAYRDGREPFVAFDGIGGWLPTGDVGRWLDDGRLHVDGRRGDLIITGGENVWPEAVERALRTDPRVGDVAVTGTTDPEWGQIVTAYVVPVGPVAPTLDDLRRVAKESLPAYCAPRALYVVDEIPRTALGKTRRTELRP